MEEEEVRNTFLTIRTTEHLKHRFQALFYLLRSKGIVERQDELIEAIIRLWERNPELLKRLLRREFR